jgi:hypothetical protein
MLQLKFVKVSFRQMEKFLGDDESPIASSIDQSFYK